MKLTIYLGYTNNAFYRPTSPNICPTYIPAPSMYGTSCLLSPLRHYELLRPSCVYTHPRVLCTRIRIMNDTSCSECIAGTLDLYDCLQNAPHLSPPNISRSNRSRHTLVRDRPWWPTTNRRIRNKHDKPVSSKATLCVSKNIDAQKATQQQQQKTAKNILPKTPRKCAGLCSSSEIRPSALIYPPTFALLQAPVISPYTSNIYDNIARTSTRCAVHVRCIKPQQFQIQSFKVSSFTFLLFYVRTQEFHECC